MPARLRPAVVAIYRFARAADDLADEGNATAAERVAALDAFDAQLGRIHRGAIPVEPPFPALAAAIRDHDLPMPPFHDLVSAFRQDVTVTRYANFEGVRDYCRRSADPVGRLVLQLFECDSPQNRAWSDSICTGLQLANFWQDVGRDHAIGLRYLPLSDALRFGYSEEDWKNSRTTPGFVELMKYQVERARTLLINGQPLISALRGRPRVVIELFMLGGLQILREIEKIGYRVWDQRPHVSKKKLLWQGAKSLVRQILTELTARG